MKKIRYIQRGDNPHWVGDGFPVRSIFTYNDLAQEISPFLLMDYGGPVEFTPSEKIRGVGEHPHRGFETVTIVYKGEVAHHDSTGEGGVIGPGDVQWMTAASGILHQEYHSDAFTKEGGVLDMVQLWVNLPSDAKSAPAGYQLLKESAIPVLPLPDHTGQLRIIAGDYHETKGAAKTNNFIARKEAVAHFLRLKSKFFLDPRCKVLRKGFLSEYKFEETRSAQSGEFKEKFRSAFHR